MLDSIFGSDNFMNTVVWQYKNKPLFSFMRYFPRDFDAILVYAKALGSHTHVHQNVPVEKARKQNVVTWDPVLKKRISKRDEDGNIEYNFSTEKIVGSVWDIPMVNPAGSERLNYPTQKPNEL
jgi:site-specific DNA-methyltransferase (adenine-specific)/adenine-specific DNA-methyltransferase